MKLKQLGIMCLSAEIFGSQRIGPPKLLERSSALVDVDDVDVGHASASMNRTFSNGEVA
jgi:hypothetical protein